MKKFYMTAILAGITVAGFSQRVSSVDSHIDNTLNIQKLSQTKAAGDTLLFFDGSGFFIADAQDENDFVLENADYDFGTPAAGGWPSAATAFQYSFFSTDPQDFRPGHDVDTAWFIGATSWFNPAGQADNWWSFGPITIPAVGADLSWYHRTLQETYSDGYQVFVSTTGAVPYTDVDPSSDTPLFVKPDCNTCVADTSWVQKSINLNQYASQRIYIHFHHNAFDQNVLYLDHMVITEGTGSISVAENSDEFSVSLFPNPATSVVNVNLNLQDASNPTLSVSDMTGKIVDIVSLGNRTAGQNHFTYSTSELSNGLYFFTINADGNTKTSKISIVK